MSPSDINGKRSVELDGIKRVHEGGALFFVWYTVRGDVYGSCQRAGEKLLRLPASGRLNALHIFIRDRRRR